MQVFLFYLLSVVNVISELKLNYDLTRQAASFIRGRKQAKSKDENHKWAQVGVLFICLLIFIIPSFNGPNKVYTVKSH